ncbi:PhnD/SsuA/transferrin family substrate-binding protein [Photobacterium frigidiphilum]|uniref:PhnD/SsuA/transferrin family substrate-binding protein n=1 Tax=Photobacterium frigidiphilum TaxID=264736 RepID=UPI003D1237AB
MKKYCLGFLLILCAQQSAQADVELVFGIYTSDKATAMVKQFRPMLNVIEAKMTSKLGEPVQIRMQISKNYQEGLNHLIDGKIDFARFGPASYILAKEAKPQITLLAMESNNGSKTFNGVICVHSNSTIESVNDLKGKSFAFGDENSTIGRYLSQAYLAQHSITSKQLEHYSYLGRHDKVGTAVATEQFDAGALKENTFKKLVKKGAPLKAIAYFENVTKPWIASATLDEKITISLQETLLSITDPNALKAIKKDGFLLATDSDYKKIRMAMANTQFFNE